MNQKTISLWEILFYLIAGLAGLLCAFVLSSVWLKDSYSQNQPPSSSQIPQIKFRKSRRPRRFSADSADSPVPSRPTQSPQSPGSRSGSQSSGFFQAVSIFTPTKALCRNAGNVRNARRFRSLWSLRNFRNARRFRSLWNFRSLRKSKSRSFTRLQPGKGGGLGESSCGETL